MYEYHLDWKYAAAPDKHPRPQPCGYLIGLQLDAATTLAPDLITPATYTGVPNYPGIGKAYDPATKQMRTCGIIESLRWDGQPASMLDLSCFVSQPNQQLLFHALLDAKAAMPILNFKFWVIGYEFPVQSGKPGTWYEMAYPIGAPNETPGAVHGRVNHTGAKLDLEVSEIPTPIDPTGVKMFAISMKMLPAVNTYFAMFEAGSPTNGQVLPWGKAVQ